jgi:nucleoside-diphosphate-sugar epimerase
LRQLTQTAFVLGGTGQIGRAVSRRLTEAGWDVTVGARREPDPPLDTRRPFVVDMTKASTELGYRPVATYAQAVEKTIAWLVDARPAAATYMQPMFDYRAEDAFLRGLSDPGG